MVDPIRRQAGAVQRPPQVRQDDDWSGHSTTAINVPVVTASKNAMLQGRKQPGAAG
jgi:hypothetical protein